MLKRITPVQTRLKLFLPLTTISALLFIGVGFKSNNAVIAQASPELPTFAVPSSLPSGTTIKVDGSSRMTTINEALKQRFQEQFAGTQVDLAANGTQAALQALLKGDIDLVAVGRPLTEEEKAQGLKEAPVSREKIAIIVGLENPYQSSLTPEQFAQIFRGEITDWSELGGSAGPIRLVDHPESSDTRQSLSQYPMFQAAPFKAGASTISVATDETSAIISALGKDGIGYAIASQVLGRNDVKILPLHDTLPDDERYPFSQPFGYVYKDNPNPQTQAFLGYVTSVPGQAIVVAAKKTESTVGTGVVETDPGLMTPTPIASPTETTESAAPVATSPSGSFPWWWLLLPILGLPALLLWARGRGVPPVIAAAQPAGRVILTPRTCRDAYAYWEIPEAVNADLQAQGGRSLALRVYDVTDIKFGKQAPHSVKQFECDLNAVDRHLPIALDDRDYLVELGYITDDGQWLNVARSESVRVPACSNEEKIQTAAAAAVAAAPHLASPPTWNQESDQDKLGTVVSARFDAAKGAVANLTGEATNVAGSVLAGGTAAIAGMGATAKSLMGRDTEPLETATRSTVGLAPKLTPDCRIILVPRNAHEAYAYWDVADNYKAIVREQGGTDLLLRIHDVTNLDIDQEAPHSTQTYPCQETDRDQHVPIPVSDRDYIAELGYMTSGNRWLRIIRSFHVHVPPEVTPNA